MARLFMLLVDFKFSLALSTRLQADTQRTAAWRADGLWGTNLPTNTNGYAETKLSITHFSARLMPNRLLAAWHIIIFRIT